MITKCIASYKRKQKYKDAIVRKQAILIKRRINEVVKIFDTPAAANEYALDHLVPEPLEDIAGMVTIDKERLDRLRKVRESFGEIPSQECFSIPEPLEATFAILTSRWSRIKYYLIWKWIWRIKRWTQL